MSATYRPRPGATLDEIAVVARRCGRDLAPTDPRAAWIDALDGAKGRPPGDAYGVACDAYHEGQAEQYECEPWP